MQATPVRVPLPVLADQYAETDAGAFVASIAELMESDHLGFDVALCPNRRGVRHDGAGDRNSRRHQQ
jgi:hypothetical protein